MIKRVTLASIKLFIAAVAIVWLVRSGRLDFQALQSVPIGRLHLLGMATVLASMLLQAFRWKLLLTAQSVRVPVRRVLEISWIAHFFSLSFLGAWGAEALRVFYTAREVPDAKARGALSIFLDRIIGIYSLLCVSCLAFGVMSLRGPMSLRLLRTAALSAAMFGIATAIGATVWHPVARRRALMLLPKNSSAVIEAAAQRWRPDAAGAVECLILALLGSALLLAAFMVAGQLVGTPLGLVEVLAAGPLVVLAGNLPISPGGIGIAEAAASALFMQFGIGTGAAIMLIVRCWHVLLRLPGGLVYALGRGGTFEMGGKSLEHLPDE